VWETGSCLSVFTLGSPVGALRRQGRYVLHGLQRRSGRRRSELPECHGNLEWAGSVRDQKELWKLDYSGFPTCLCCDWCGGARRMRGLRENSVVSSAPGKCPPGAQAFGVVGLPGHGKRCAMKKAYSSYVVRSIRRPSCTRSPSTFANTSTPSRPTMSTALTSCFDDLG